MKKNTPKRAYEILKHLHDGYDHWVSAGQLKEMRDRGLIQGTKETPLGKLIRENEISPEHLQKEQEGEPWESLRKAVNDIPHFKELQDERTKLIALVGTLHAPTLLKMIQNLPTEDLYGKRMSEIGSIPQPIVSLELQSLTKDGIIGTKQSKLDFRRQLAYVRPPRKEGQRASANTPAEQVSTSIKSEEEKTGIRGEKDNKYQQILKLLEHNPAGVPREVIEAVVGKRAPGIEEELIAMGLCETSNNRLRMSKEGHLLFGQQISLTGIKLTGKGKSIDHLIQILPGELIWENEEEATLITKIQNGHQPKLERAVQGFCKHQGWEVSTL